MAILLVTGISPPHYHWHLPPPPPPPPSPPPRPAVHHGRASLATSATCSAMPSSTLAMPTRPRSTSATSASPSKPNSTFPSPRRRPARYIPIPPWLLGFNAVTCCLPSTIGGRNEKEARNTIELIGRVVWFLSMSLQVSEGSGTYDTIDEHSSVITNT